VLTNTIDTVFLVQPFALMPAAGATYRLEREECFEPDPARPIEPASFDPHNPQNAANQGLARSTPVVYVRRTFDDMHPAADDATLVAAAGGAGYPLLPAIGARGPNQQTHDGIRFQQIYRDVDCAPGSQLGGQTLDLYRISWAAFGAITADLYSDISLHVGHSSHRPFLYAGDGQTLPQNAAYIGLGEPFDFDTWVNSWLGSGPRCSFGVSINQGPNRYGRDRILRRSCRGAGAAVSVLPVRA
jgi:hypothetical protein